VTPLFIDVTSTLAAYFEAAIREGEGTERRLCVVVPELRRLDPNLKGRKEYLAMTVVC